jgi:hypothetical protein
MKNPLYCLAAFQFACWAWLGVRNYRRGIR